MQQHRLPLQVPPLRIADPRPAQKENMGKPGVTLPPRPNSKWTNPFSSLLQPETLLFPRDDSTPVSPDESTATSSRTSNDNTSNSGALDNTSARSGNAQPPSSTAMMMPAGGVSPSGDFDDLDIPSTSSRESTSQGVPHAQPTASAGESADRYNQQQQHGHHNNTQGVMVDQHLGPVDRLLLLVADGQSLSRRVLGNERQSARLGERLSALKNPLWQLQARVRTQAEHPPEFIHTLAEQVSHCLDVLLELTHPDWWNQIRRKVRRGACSGGYS